MSGAFGNADNQVAMCIQCVIVIVIDSLLRWLSKMDVLSQDDGSKSMPIPVLYHLLGPPEANPLTQARNSLWRMLHGDSDLVWILQLRLWEWTREGLSAEQAMGSWRYWAFSATIMISLNQLFLKECFA